MTASLADWSRAQEGELRYHLTRAWRQHGLALHRTYTALIGIGESECAGKTVIDVGCGPHSSLLTVPVAGGSLALDPLTFAEDDEARYAARGIRRAVSAAEDFRPWETPGARATWQEAWCYNCLQHTRDPALVLAHVARYAVERVRLFEWVDVPLDTLHLHRLRPETLRAPFTGWARERELTGTWETPNFCQHFYAAVWRHPTSH